MKRNFTKTIITAVVMFAMVLTSAVAINMTPSTRTVQAATGDITAATNINVGDYIDNFGGIKWRVIGKDTNGLLVRTDRALTNAQLGNYAGKDATNDTAWFSEARAGYRNDVVNTIARRAVAGTNYWGESDMRKWLNNETTGFASNFSTAEFGVIKTVQQKQLLWWGDVVASSNNASGVTNGYTVSSHNPVISETSATPHTYNSTTADIMQNYNTADFYTISDKIFLPDTKQVYESSSASGSLLTNVAGYPYHMVCSSAGAGIISWTRSPVANDPTNNGDMRRVGGASDAVSSSPANTKHAVAPALYISNSAVFTEVRASDNTKAADNGKEQSGYKVYSFSADDTDIVAAKTAVQGATYVAVTQATLNTQSAAKTAVQLIINGLELNGVNYSIVDEVFTAAIAGTPSSTSGTNGSYKFKVQLTKGAATAQTTSELTLTITATPYSDNDFVSAAKGLVEGATYGSVLQATLNTSALAKIEVQNTITALNLVGVSYTIIDENFTAATTGTATNLNGINGFYKFKVTLTRNAASQTTIELTLTITATPASNNDYITAANTIVTGADICGSNTSQHNHPSTRKIGGTSDY